ncbi:MAG: Maf family protein [Thermodesulfobacteriota bacterium]
MTGDDILLPGPLPGAFRAVLPLLLASASPRRRRLLGSLGVEFTVLPGSAEPDPDPGEGPADYALRAARAKAEEAAALRPESLVIAADTIVVLGSEIMGKPRDEAHAVAMLTRLAGNTHQVITGCCLFPPGGNGRKPATFAAFSDVTMVPATREMLAAYAATGEPADKAGAYAIQGKGGFLVERVSGSYTNVVGLPLAKLCRALLDMGAIAVRAAGHG